MTRLKFKNINNVYTTDTLISQDGKVLVGTLSENFLNITDKNTNQVVYTETVSSLSSGKKAMKVQLLALGVRFDKEVRNRRSVLDETSSVVNE